MKCGVRLARADIVFKLSTKTRADIVFKLSTKKTIKLFLSASGGAASMWFGDSGSLVLLVQLADIGFNIHNPLDPLEPSPTILDQQVPRPTTPLYPQHHIFYPIRW